MANIEISNLQPAGAALLFGSEGSASFVRDLTEEELKIKGGSKGKSYSKSYSKKYSSSFKKKPYYSYY
jgi:hypothetical protein